MTNSSKLAAKPTAQASVMNRIQPYFLYFLLYSICGWIYEVFLEVVVYQWGFTNRGFLYGPYCPVYGVGALIFLLCLKKLKARRMRLGGLNVTPILVFLSSMAIATALELFTSYLMEAATGSWMWDYTGYAVHFQGRIALNPSVRFGIGGVLILYLIQPIFERLIRWLGTKRLHVIFVVSMTVFLVDSAVTLITKCFS